MLDYSVQTGFSWFFFLSHLVKLVKQCKNRTISLSIMKSVSSVWHWSYFHRLKMQSQKCCSFMCFKQLFKRAQLHFYIYIYRKLIVGFSFYRETYIIILMTWWHAFINLWMTFYSWMEKLLGRNLPERNIYSPKVTCSSHPSSKSKSIVSSLTMTKNLKKLIRKITKVLPKSAHLKHTTCFYL